MILVVMSLFVIPILIEQRMNQESENNEGSEKFSRIKSMVQGLL